MTLTTLGQALQKARFERGMSYRAAGAELGVSHQQVKRWEDGLDRFAEERLAPLAQFTGLKIAKVREMWAAENSARQHDRIDRSPAGRMAHLEGEVTELRQTVEAQTLRLADQERMLEDMGRQLDRLIELAQATSTSRQRR